MYSWDDRLLEYEDEIKEKAIELTEDEFVIYIRKLKDKLNK